MKTAKELIEERINEAITKVNTGAINAIASSLAKAVKEKDDKAVWEDLRNLAETTRIYVKEHDSAQTEIIGLLDKAARAMDKLSK